MQSNKLRMAIRATAAATVFGVAGQAGAVSLNAGDYDVNLYGFARVAATYDIDQDIANGGQAGNFSKIATGSGDTADGHFGMDANTSRIGLSVMSPQDVKVVVEFDFDNSDSLDPRLRLAYGEYQGIMIGRNWSNYNSFVGNGATLDFDALPGTAGNQSRTEQIRYTTGAISVSLEQPFESGIAGGVDKTGSPAFTARIEDSQGDISYSAAVMAKQTSFDDGSDDDSAFGYGAFLAGKIALTDMISINGAINFTDGANGYVYRAGGNFGQIDAYNDGGDIETVESYGGALSASMGLGGGRSINLGYGMATVDLDDAVDAGAVTADTTDTNTMVFVNYRWTPVEKVSMGVEYAYLETETQGGDDGDANRLMFLAQYSF